MRAGFFAVDITPPIGVPMGGNSRADSRNRGVHDPLFASISFLEHGDTHLGLVSFDLVALSDSMIDGVKAAVRDAGIVSPDDLVFFATHTHSGPATTGGNGFDTNDYSAVYEWEREIVPRVAEGIGCAQQALEDVSMRMFTTEAPGFAFNRRLLLDGKAHMNWAPVPMGSTPAGPTDDKLTVLTFTNKAGDRVGALVHFTLHPAVLVGHDWLTSSDYVDSLRNSLTNLLGNVPIVYAGGAFGNINHLDAHQVGRAIGFEESERIGRGIAAAFAPIQNEGRSCENVLSLESFVVTLQQRTVDAESLKRAEAMVEANAGRPIDALDGRPPVSYALWTVQVGQYLTEELDVEVKVAEVGGLTFVFLPFEVFVEFGLGLQQAFPEKLVKVVSLASGSRGYLPTAEAFDQGGYEPSLGTSTVSRGQGEYLFAEITDWLRAREDARAQSREAVQHA